MIAAGYGKTPREIGRFTWRQLQLFFAEEQARERRGRRGRVIDTNAGTAGGRAAKKLIDDLED